MVELSTKTCLQFLPVPELPNEANTSAINFLAGNNSNKIRPSGASPLNISISSWETIADELVDSLCIFHQDVHPDGIGGIVGLEESQAIVNCLSGKSSRGGTKLGYIHMLDAEKINTLYNCSGKFPPLILYGNVRPSGILNVCFGHNRLPVLSVCPTFVNWKYRA